VLARDLAQLDNYLQWRKETFPTMDYACSEASESLQTNLLQCALKQLSQRLPSRNNLALKENYLQW
jgi:hypothetical protein